MGAHKNDFNMWPTSISIIIVLIIEIFSVAILYQEHLIHQWQI